LAQGERTHPGAGRDLRRPARRLRRLPAPEGAGPRAVGDHASHRRRIM